MIYIITYHICYRHIYLCISWVSVGTSCDPIQIAPISGVWACRWRAVRHSYHSQIALPGVSCGRFLNLGNVKGHGFPTVFGSVGVPILSLEKQLSGKVVPSPKWWWKGKLDLVSKHRRRKLKTATREQNPWILSGMKFTHQEQLVSWHVLAYHERFLWPFPSPPLRPFPLPQPMAVEVTEQWCFVLLSSAGTAGNSAHFAVCKSDTGAERWRRNKANQLLAKIPLPCTCLEAPNRLISHQLNGVQDPVLPLVG